MFSKRELKQYLEEISENAVLVNYQFVSPDKFAVQLKCKTNGVTSTNEYNKYAAEWIAKFAKFTATTWIVRNSYPRLKRLLFRKVFCCHRSAFNKKKECSDDARNQGCRAKIDFKVKITNRNTIKNDPLLKEGLNMTISIDFTHSHKLRTQEAFSRLKSTPETDEMFYNYFDNGYSPVMAKLYHELAVIHRYGDHPEYLMNANINPTIRHIHYLHAKIKKSGESNKTFDEIMSAKKATLERDGGFLNYENPNVVTVVTATMRRVILTMNLEHILMDSIFISNELVVTFLYAVSNAGALPIACVLHTQQDEANYSQAFLTTKLLIEDHFNCQFEPKLLTIKDSQAIRDAATSIFPKSIILSSHWSVCSNIWRRICSDDSKIDAKKRHSLMELFSNFIRGSRSLAEAEINYEKLKEDDYIKSSLVIRDYVDDLWQRRGHWLHGEDHVSTNLVEASTRIMGEFIHQKCKSFNAYAMIDVLCNIIDGQISRILHAHARSSDIVSTYTRFLGKSKEVLNFDSTLKRIDPNEFKLESGSKTKKFIKFRIDTWCCDCGVGKKGRFCEHLCAVINVVDTDLIRIAELTDEEKCLLTDIAGAECEEKTIKPECTEEAEDMDIDDIKDDELVDDAEGGIDDDVDKYSASSPKSENDDDYYYLEIKNENCERNDPLDDLTEEKCEDISFSIQNNKEVPCTSKIDLKTKYEEAMKGLNNEFRRLNKFFKANPNKSNMETMVRLAKELAKIRPVERVNLRNMNIAMNENEDCS